jgi:hypothetical protein
MKGRRHVNHAGREMIAVAQRMLDRLRWASDGGDLAFLHASATHLLFEEMSSIIHSLTKDE